MKNLFLKTASFQEVKEDEEALVYHAVKFQSGHRYPLALLCYAEIERRNAKTSSN